MRHQAFFSRMPHCEAELGTPAELLVQRDLPEAKPIFECVESIFVGRYIFARPRTSRRRSR